MILTLQQAMENSFVISIDDRQYETFKKHISSFSNILPKRFNGFTIPNAVYSKSGFIKSSNVINCTLSHVSLVKYAQMMNIPYIFVFEDDAVPHIDISVLLPDMLKNIPPECDMLKIGILGYRRTEIQSYNEFWDINNRTRGSHAYMIFKRYYEKYLENVKTNPVADGLCMNDRFSNIYTSKTNMFLQRTHGGIHSTHSMEITESSYSKEFIDKFQW